MGKLLHTVHSTMTLLSDLDAEKENEIKISIGQYHSLLQLIESSLKKQINECREPLLLPLLPIGHKNQYISDDAREIHKKIFADKAKEHQDQKKQSGKGYK